MFITQEHPDRTVTAQPSAFNAELVLVWMQPVSKLYMSGQLSPCLCLERFSLWRAEEPKEPLANSLSSRPRLAGKAQPRSTDGMCLTPCLSAELFHKCSTIDPACSRQHSGPNANIFSHERCPFSDRHCSYRPAHFSVLNADSPAPGQLQLICRKFGGFNNISRLLCRFALWQTLLALHQEVPQGKKNCAVLVLVLFRDGYTSCNVRLSQTRHDHNEKYVAMSLILALKNALWGMLEDGCFDGCPWISDHVRNLRWPSHSVTAAATQKCCTKWPDQRNTGAKKRANRRFTACKGGKIHHKLNVGCR